MMIDGKYEEVIPHLSLLFPELTSGVFRSIFCTTLRFIGFLFISIYLHSIFCVVWSFFLVLFCRRWFHISGLYFINTSESDKTFWKSVQPFLPIHFLLNNLHKLYSVLFMLYLWAQIPFFMHFYPLLFTFVIAWYCNKKRLLHFCAAWDG